MQSSHFDKSGEVYPQIKNSLIANLDKPGKLSFAGDMISNRLSSDSDAKNIYCEKLIDDEAKIKKEIIFNLYSTIAKHADADDINHLIAESKDHVSYGMRLLRIERPLFFKNSEPTYGDTDSYKNYYKALQERKKELKSIKINTNNINHSPTLYGNHSTTTTTTTTTITSSSVARNSSTNYIPYSNDDSAEYFNQIFPDTSVSAR